MPRTLLIFLLLAAGTSAAAELQVALPEPEWLLPPLREPLTLREPVIRPGEQSVTNEVWPLVEAGNYRDAVAVLEDELPMEEENPYRQVSAALNHLLAQLYLQTGEPEKAEAALRESLVQLPSFVRAHQALGFLYLQQERYEDARAHIVEAASLGGDSPELFGYLGYLNQQTGNHWGAISAYQRALMYGDANLQWRQGLLFNLIEAQQFASARAYLDDLLREFPDDSSIWLYRAHAALQAGEDETALASLEAALRLGDTTASNLKLAARLHLQAGSVARGVALQRRGLAAEFDFDLLDQSLAWLLHEQQWDYARQLIEGGRERWDSLGDTQKSRLLDGEARLAETDDMERAVQLLEEALEFDPANAEALLRLAGHHASARRYVQAELLYRRATAYDSSRERAQLGIAQLAIDQLEYARALETLREVLSENPDRVELRRNVQILENLVSAGQNAEAP